MTAPDRFFCLGIDIGTSSCKVCVVDAAGTLVGAAGYPYETYSPFDGWAEQDPSDWLKAVVEAVRNALSSTRIDATRVRLLSLTSAAHIAVLTDGHDKPLRRAILWNDQRSVAEAREFSESHGDFIIERTFNSVSTTWTLPHLAWIRKHDPQAWSQTACICFSKDFIARWLTGELFTDPATAVSAMLYDAISGRWSEELCGLVGLRPDMLPQVKPVMSVCGHLRPDAASMLNLQPGIPVVNGTLDSASETYCAGALQAGDCVIRLGTAGGIHVVKAAPRPHPQLITYPHPIGNLWYSQAGTNSAGTAINKMIRLFGGEPSISLDERIKQASAIPAGSNGLFFHPFLSGERCPYWDPLLRGTFSGISFQHGPAHFVRAVIEGVSFSLKDAFLTITAEEPCRDNIRVVGGGTANSLWVKILSDILGQPLIIMRGADSAYGTALLGLAAVATSEASLSELQPARAQSLQIQPCDESHQTYKIAFAAYKALCSGLLSLYHESALREFRDKLEN